MREIEFRGKSVNGEWYYGLLSISQGKSGQPKKGYYISNKAGMPWAYQIIPETVGQYTGLKDNKRTKEHPKGQEIYEGDILKISVDKDKVHNEWQKNIKPEFAEVSFNNFHWNCSKGKGKSLYNYSTIGFVIIEVVGNIYENPELLN
ncbi:MAG: YopX family protein [bacterium]